MRLPQRLEHAAALDAAELLVVAGKNEFRAGCARGGGEPGQVLGRHHGRLVDDQDGLFIPCRPPVFEQLQFAGDGVRVGEPVAAHLLCHVVRPGEADYLAALGLVNGTGGV